MYNKIIAIICDNNIEEIKNIFDNISVDRTNTLVHYLCFSSSIGRIDIVKLIPQDINPSSRNNHSIISSYKNMNTNIVELLWKDQRVKNTLKNDDLSLYNKLIKEDITNKIKAF